MSQRSHLPLLIFAGLMFVVFVMMFVAILPKQTVVFTDEEEEVRTGIQAYDPVNGSPDAPIIITHYSDFLCESCSDVAEALNRVAQDYPDEITLVWKDFPNVYAHPLAPEASLAARCAGEQAAFWEYHDYLFSHQQDLTEETASELFSLIAEEVGIGSWRFNRCMNGQHTFEDMEMSYQDGLDLELISAPTISVNEEWFTGTISESELRSVILNLEL